MATVTRPPDAPGEQDADATIIRRSPADPERFAALFDRYHDAIHGYAARRLGPALADDVLELLRDSWAAPPAPSPGFRAAARAALLERAADAPPPVRRRRGCASPSWAYGSSPSAR